MALSRIPNTQALNTIKNRLREVTKLLDATTDVYPPSLEAHQLKREVIVLLTELQVHGLLPETVSVADGKEQAMNDFTQAVWDVFGDQDALREELLALMKREHKPFFNLQQSFEVNVSAIKQVVQERFERWIEWLPTTPTDCLGAALAEEAFEQVDWQFIGALLLEGTYPVKDMVEL